MKARDRMAKRWLVAQEMEKKAVEDAEIIKEFLSLRRHTWARLIEKLKGEITLGNSCRTLEIGGGPTSIFLAIKEGDKYAADPVYDRLFDQHPFMREVAEYRDVNFIALPLEELAFDKKFDVVFLVNVLDHVGNLEMVVSKIDELLLPGGFVVVAVDCYADPVVKSVVSFFDPDPPHPHHFTADEVIRLFPGYRLKKQDRELFTIYIEDAFRGPKTMIPAYRIDKLFNRMIHYSVFVARKRDIPFVLKYVLCYSLALSVASLRRRERPIYPFKKARLFLFQKP